MTIDSPHSKVEVQTSAFDVSVLTDELAGVSHEVGGVATFVGVVRDVNEGDSVSSLFLEHYPGMTEQQIAGIIDDAGARFDVLSATVIHRVGELHPGEQIVFVGVASRHRGEAFDACEFIIDFLKTRATFWKKERTDDGERWLETRESDLDVVESWKR